MKLFCFGLGFSALALARELKAEGWTVAGTVRSADKQAKLKGEGIETYVFDGTAAMENALQALAGTTHLLDSIPPQPDMPAPPVFWHGGDLAALEDLVWAGYLSTTGVYGDHGGGRVNEDTPAAPTMDRSRRRAEAEEMWLMMAERYGMPVHIFRLAGIYGPGRGVLRQVQSGRAKRVVKPGQVFSRIHVDDIIQVLRASMAQIRPGRIYNVCDDEAEAPDKVVAYVCDLLGLEPPPETPFDEADLSDMAKSFYRDNKRVDNSRIKDELGVRLRFPSYRDGIPADLAKTADGGPSTPSPLDGEGRGEGSRVSARKDA
ncbi:MAG: SDR family oxidoreductase [Pseudomonadota bacterium]